MNKVLDKSYENDEFFKKWLVGLRPRTKRNYSDEIHDWFIFTGMSPTEQIQKRMHDLTTVDITQRQFFEDKFREYKEYLEQRGKRLNGEPMKPSAVTTLLTPVASFFSRNGLPLALKRGDWESALPQPVTKKPKLIKEDIKAMYSHGNTRDRALLLMLSQSGPSEADVSILHVEDFPELYSVAEGQHVFYEKAREKTHEMQATCISYECVHDLKAMLQERGNPQSGFLFVSTTKGKGEQLEVRSINDAMKALAEKSFGKGTKKTKQFQTKMLRSFYNSALLRAAIQPQEIKDLMMGHGRQGARKNYDYDEQTIKDNYVKAFEHLSINGLQTRTDIARLKEEFTTTKAELADMIAKQQKELEKVNGKLDFFNKYVGSINDYVETKDDVERLWAFLDTLRKEKEAPKEGSQNDV